MRRSWSFTLVRKCVGVAACAVAMPYVALFFLWNGYVEGLEDWPEPAAERTLSPLVSGALWLAAGEAHATLEVESIELRSLFPDRVRDLERGGRGWRWAPGQAIVHDVARQWLADHGPPDKLARIVREHALSTLLSRHWSADDLVRWLAIHTYLGRGAVGIDAAADVNFGKPVDALSAGELAYLAGVRQMPDRFGPSQPEKARKRRDFMLRRFAEEKLITPDVLARELSSELVFRPRSASPPAGRTVEE